MAPPEPMRVAIFGESYLPYLSGVTIATDALARGLMEAGQQVLLVMPRPAHERGSGGNSEGSCADIVLGSLIRHGFSVK